jgi:hypothetical protein
MGVRLSELHKKGAFHLGLTRIVPPGVRLAGRSVPALMSDQVDTIEGGATA